MSDSGDEVEVKKPTEDDEEVDQSLANSDVTTKYQEAAKIANAVLEAMLAKVEPGVDPIDICRVGDEMIEEKCKKIFTKKAKGQAIEKGVAFPTCVSVNECVCHNSPLNSEAQEPLKEGDLVKIDLGVHIDGFVAVAAHTVRAGTYVSVCGRVLRGGRVGREGCVISFKCVRRRSSYFPLVQNVLSLIHVLPSLPPSLLQALLQSPKAPSWGRRPTCSSLR